MIGEYKESFRDSEGNLNIVFIVDEMDVSKLEKLKGTDLLIKYEKFSGKKTTKQNKYFWELMKGLSTALHIKQWTAYLMILSSYGVYSDIEIPAEAENDFRDCLDDTYRYVERMNQTFDGRLKLRCYKGLHKYTKEEARHLIECATQEARDQGVEVLPPYELNALFEGE